MSSFLKLCPSINKTRFDTLCLDEDNLTYIQFVENYQYCQYFQILSIKSILQKLSKTVCLHWILLLKILRWEIIALNLLGMLNVEVHPVVVLLVTTRRKQIHIWISDLHQSHVAGFCDGLTFRPCDTGTETFVYVHHCGRKGYRKWQVITWYFTRNLEAQNEDQK